MTFVNEFGKIPKVISTDRGSHFIGEVLNELCKSLNIKQNLHCAWRPESSGILERQHRTFKDSIFIVSKELGQSWPFLVGQVVQAMNAAENRATKVSPFYAMYGRHYSLDIPIVESRDYPIENPLSHGMHLGTKLAKIHKLVRFCSEAADLKLDEKSNPSKPEKLESGDKILLKRPLSSQAEAKFHWISGFTVLDTMDFAVRYKNTENGKTDWVHRSHVRKMKPRPEHLDFDSDDESEPIVTPIVKPIDNPIGKPVTDSSTGGGVVKVEPKDLQKLFDEPVSKTKPKVVPKTKNIVPTVSSRPRRTRKPPDRLNIASTDGRSYAHVAGLS